MKKIFLLSAFLLTLMSSASVAQYREGRYPLQNDPAEKSLKIGTQIPFQHSIIYDHGITRTLSINGGIGLITGPYTNMLFSGLENKGLISRNERAVIDRTFQLGVSYQLGANFHFDRNYIRAYGQLMTLNGDMSYTDLANIYLGTNIPDIARFLNPIDIRSTVPMVGALYGRRFAVGERSEIHVEGSIAKTLGHQTNYRTGTFLDGLNLVDDVVYSGIDNDLDSYFTKNGWLPSLSVYYVYKF